MKNPNYTPTPLQQLIAGQIQSGNPQSFAIADFGEGPILTYRGRHVHLDLVTINLVKGTQHVKISHRTHPYIVLLSQNMRGKYVNLVLYGADSMPVIEYKGTDGLRGQVFGYAQAVNGENPVAAYALFQPHCALDFPKSSLHMEQNPELCNHLAACAAMIDELFQPEERGSVYEP